ncbi:hypothetical protein SAMN02745125_01863 [Campylobacter helveticus]|nr:hypothetical protein SAMN02745125_01863 [Campylobacter helveticus]
MRTCCLKLTANYTFFLSSFYICFYKAN